MATVQYDVEPYGTFTARVRDFETDLRITCRADEQIAARGFDPKIMSPGTRSYFDMLAIFSETCEKSPQNFSIADLLKEPGQKALNFLSDYCLKLVQEETRFRNPVPDVPQGNALG